jgi:hypothetical protein
VGQLLTNQVAEMVLASECLKVANECVETERCELSACSKVGQQLLMESVVEQEVNNSCHSVRFVRCVFFFLLLFYQEEKTVRAL